MKGFIRLVICAGLIPACTVMKSDAQCENAGSQDFNNISSLEEAGWDVVDKAKWGVIAGRIFMNGYDVEIPNQPRRCVTLSPQIGMQDFWFEVDVWYLGERSGIFIPIRGVGAHQYTYLAISGPNGGMYCDGELCLRTDYIIDDIVYHGDPFARTPNTYPFSDTDPLHVRVECEGMHYKAFINGELKLEGDAPEYARYQYDWWGRPGFGAAWEIGAWFDNTAWGPLECEQVSASGTGQIGNRVNGLQIMSAGATAENGVMVNAAFPAEGKYYLRIHDAQGRCISSATGHGRSGKMTIDIPDTRMKRSEQIYVVSLQLNGEGVSSVTIVK